MARKEKGKVDASQGFLDRIQASVYKRQSRLVSILKGKHVVRNGVLHRVKKVDRRGNFIVVSDMKTDDSLYLKMNLKAFLSKKVRILKDEEL